MLRTTVAHVESKGPSKTCGAHTRAQDFRKCYLLLHYNSESSTASWFVGVTAF